MKSVKNPKYLKWIRSQECCVTQTPAFGFTDIVCHHINMKSYGLRGIGSKVSDYRVVPMTAIEHTRLHHVGERSYWQEVDIDPFQISLDLLIAYLDQK